MSLRRNAFAAPAGYIFVTRGLLKQIKNEAELAAVLGHEIAHVSEKHILDVIQRSKQIAGISEAGLAYAAANPIAANGEVDLINNKLKTPYSDQFSLGMRNAVTLWGHDWNTAVTLQHIRARDGFYGRLGSRRPDGSFHQFEAVCREEPDLACSAGLVTATSCSLQEAGYTFWAAHLDDCIHRPEIHAQIKTGGAYHCFEDTFMQGFFHPDP